MRFSKSISARASLVPIALILFISSFADLFAEGSLSLEPIGKKIFAIGDIHGDFDALVEILKSLKLIDSQANWIASEPIDLVIMGDEVERGPDSEGVLILLDYIEKLAAQNGSRVTRLLGNHDLRYFSERDDYQASLRARPSIVKIGRNLFVHAGIEKRHLTMSLEEMGAESLGGDNSLVDTRALAYGQSFRSINTPSPEELSLFLARLGVDRIILGHTHTYRIGVGLEIILDHPVYAKQVVMIDTGINSYSDGVLSALEIEDSQLIPLYFDRPKEFTHRLMREKCKNALRLSTKD